MNVGNFTGTIYHLVANGEDIYFSATEENASAPAIYKTRLSSTTSPEKIYEPDSSVLGIGGLAMNSGVLYVAEFGDTVPFWGRISQFKKILPTEEAIDVLVRGRVMSMIVKNGTLHWTDGSNVRKFFALNNPSKITELQLNGRVGILGFDAVGVIHLSLLSRNGYVLVDTVDVGHPLFNSEQSPCTAGFAGYAGAGTYFAHTTCHANGEQIPGSLTYVDVEQEGGGDNYAPGEVVDGPASAVTVTGSGEVVWASVEERSLRTLTVQKNTLVGTPPAAGTYPIKLTLSNGEKQEFTITVTAPTVTYAVGGDVYGLLGTVRLSNNGTDILSISNAEEGNSPFSFSKELEEGDAYNVAVVASPAGQTCTLDEPESASGTMGTADVEVSVICEYDNYTVGGTVSGLDGTLGLSLTSERGNENLNVSDDEFEFGLGFFFGDEYEVTIEDQPAGQTCELDNTFLNEEGDTVTPVISGPVGLSITCEDLPAEERTLSVTVEGLPSGTVAIRATGPEDGRWLTETKPFGLGTGSFTNTLRDGEEYVFQVIADPEGYTCLFNGSVFTDGIVDGNVTVTVTCAASGGGGGGELPPGPEDL